MEMPRNTPYYGPVGSLIPAVSERHVSSCAASLGPPCHVSALAMGLAMPLVCLLPDLDPPSPLSLPSTGAWYFAVVFQRWVEKGNKEVLWFLMIFHFFVYFTTLTCRRGVLVEGDWEDYDVSRQVRLTCNAVSFYVENIYCHYWRPVFSILHRQWLNWSHACWRSGAKWGLDLACSAVSAISWYRGFP